MISHAGTANTRTFQEVAQTGRILEALSEKLYGSDTPAETAILMDTENKWALSQCRGPRNDGLDYYGNIRNNYHYFWKNGIHVDFVDSTYDLSGYRLVIAPMLYMFRRGMSEKLRQFVRDGGTLITTCFTGVADENDLCFLGEATEEKLSDVLGLWIEEVDALYSHETNRMVWDGKTYSLYELCEIARPTACTCEILSTYEEDFYRGMPALTRNRFGQGEAYHLCATAGQDFFDAFYEKLASEMKLERAMQTAVPAGVSLTWRENETQKWIFVQNFGDAPANLTLNQSYTDLLTGEPYRKNLVVDGLSFAIITPSSS